MVSRVLICTGKYANEPYHLEKVCVNVYCVEELCYLFANNPFMINTEIMDKHLPEWLREQCGLPELADRLTLAMKNYDGETDAYEVGLPTEEGIILPCGASGLFIGK